jgi:hypothetical protein
MKWVLENQDQWIDSAYEPGEEANKSNARFGIFSGYPPHGSEVYAIYVQAEEKFTKYLAEKEPDSEWTSRQHALQPRDKRKMPSEVSSALMSAKAEDVLTEQEVSLILDRFFLPDMELFGDGFSDEDENYLLAINNFAKDLDIDTDHRNW